MRAIVRTCQNKQEADLAATFALVILLCQLWSGVCAPCYLDYRKFDGIYKKMASLLKFFPEKRKRKECFIRTSEVGSVFRV